MPQKVWLRCKAVLERALYPAGMRMVFDADARDCNESADVARADLTALGRLVFFPANPEQTRTGITGIDVLKGRIAAWH